MLMKLFLLALAFLLPISIDSLDPPDWDFDAQLANYFVAQTEKIQLRTQKELVDIADWEGYKVQARIELAEMLGIPPAPGSTPLNATVTSTVEHEEFTVKNLHFQSLPGLYVTANLYIPKNLDQKLPAIIYVCGHATVKKDGYNYGAKVNYQHHPAWFARNGYVCLILDTVQLGEIEGIHHGLHRYERWWWQSRGYTPAGVEAWNGIRAIDYLQSLPEVDPDRIGITGRSGGGITSWWVAALDERIRVAVPVAGITDLQDHVVNGCIEDHCDCMFMQNTYQWDFAKLAALVAPRPLLISNTDRDIMFPVEGVFRVYQQVRQVYEHLGAGDQLALNITAGPHRDEQELRIHAFRWLNRFLQNRDDLIDKQAVKLFEPEQLRVFKAIPADEINTTIDESFNQTAPAPETMLREMGGEKAKAQWRKGLDRIFENWPENKQPAHLEKEETLGSGLTIYSLSTDSHTVLPVFCIHGGEESVAPKARLVVLDDENWPIWATRLASKFPDGTFWKDSSSTERFSEDWEREFEGVNEIYLISVRGAGPARFSGDDFKQAQIRKRYHLLGQSLQMMQTWDIHRAINRISQIPSYGPESISVHAGGVTAGMVLYASLFVDTPLRLNLSRLPSSHMEGPYYPRVLRHMDIPAAVMLADERHAIEWSDR